MTSLTDTQLIDTFKQSASTMSGPQITSFLIGNGSYSNVDQIVAQLEHAGLTKTAATKAVHAKGPSTLQTILQAGAGFLYVPGSVAEALLGGGADATAETTASNAANATNAGSSAGNAASNLLSKYATDATGALVFAPVLAWLTTEKNWVRVLEYIGGAVMIGIAFRELARS